MGALGNREGAQQQKLTASGIMPGGGRQGRDGGLVDAARRQRPADRAALLGGLTKALNRLLAGLRRRIEPAEVDQGLGDVPIYPGKPDIARADALGEGRLLA